jgi:hypothetical protein
MALFLIIVGIGIIAFNVRAYNREKSSFKRVLHFSQEEMPEYEVKIVELRKEFAETILELQQEIIEIRQALGQNINISLEAALLNNPVAQESAGMDSEGEAASQDYNSQGREEDLQQSSNSVKIKEIDKLLKSGLTIDEICERLNIGKGEVLLIKELYIR